MLIQIILTFIASETNFEHLASKSKKYILLFTNKWFLGMWGVQTCKRRSSHSTQDYHSIKFRLFLVTLGCGGSVTAFCLLCCVVMCLFRLALFANVFSHSLQSNVVSVSNSSAAAHFHRRSFALTPESPLICWNSLTNDLICSVTNSCSASSLTFRRKSRRIVSTCFLSSSALKKVPQKLTQFALMISHHCLFYKLIWLFYEM